MPVTDPPVAPATDPFDLLDLPPEHMERAYLEFRKACYEIVFRSLVDAGGLAHLARPATTGDVAAALGVPPERHAVTQLLLDAMVRYGVVHRHDDGRYQASTTGASPRPVDPELILTATGKRNVRQLRDWMNYARLVPTLRDGSHDTGAPFDGSRLALWREALQAPYYRYPRLVAARDVAAAGPRLLDLGCGLGHGLRELGQARADDPEARIVGVEVSADFVDHARAATAADPRLSVHHGDVEDLPTTIAGLGDLADLGDLTDPGGAHSFDGAMLVGTYHFLPHPERLWPGLRRALRPGGRFCAAYVRTQRESSDRELMDLRYALRASPSVAHDRGELVDTARAHGFELEHELAMGIWGTFSFVRHD
jgi:SAM-dependent methyltransferase